MALHGNPGPRSADAASPIALIHVTPRSASGLLPSLSRRAPAETVSLAQPRPDAERITNDYVEAPLPPPRPARTPVVVAPDLAHRRTASSASQLPLPTVAGKRAGVVTKQPSSSYKRAPETTHPAAECPPPITSTICPECARCRCETCRQPRPLPEKWLCNNALYCSPEAAVDYASCLCCVRALFYHCSPDCERDDGSAPCADEPCSCASPRRFSRWGCMAALTLPLPCLLCYWPLRAVLAMVEKCYAQYTSNRGCRCRPRRTASAETPRTAELELHDVSASKTSVFDVDVDKRLLDSSPDA